MIVVDASVALKWICPEHDHAAALALADGADELVAPNIVFPEIANVLRKKIKRGELTVTAAADGFDAARRLITFSVDVAPLAKRILELALQYDHPAYDCCYVACCETLRIPMVTADRVLAAKAKQAGVRAVLLEEWSADNAD